MPQKYFQDDMRNYDDTWFCVIRELGQNSLDAGAKSISVSIEEMGDGVVRLTWDDDGCGMNRHSLKSNFLTLGASGKEFVICPKCERTHDRPTPKCKGCGWKPAGGFGTAKILICFAQAGYEILSHDYHLKGFSNGFEIEDDQPERIGCKFIIDLKCACRGCLEQDSGCWKGRLTKLKVRAAIRLWTSWSDTECEIVVEGKKMDTFSEREQIASKPATDWATMTTVKAINNPQIIIRMNGQMMGDMSGPDGMDNHVVLDINGDSTRYLTMNRCGFTGKYATEMDTFLQDLYRDPKLISKIREPETKEFIGARGKVDLGISPEERTKMLEDLMSCPTAFARAIKNQENSVHDGYTMIVRNETSANIPLKFLPGFMDKASIKLMNQWVGCLLFVGEKGDIRKAILPGWVFADDIEALRSGNQMLLNPVSISESGTMNRLYRADVDSFNRLMILAIHEMCHLNGCDYHDNRFNDEFERLAKIVLLDNAKDMRKLRARV